MPAFPLVALHFAALCLAVLYFVALCLADLYSGTITPAPLPWRVPAVPSSVPFPVANPPADRLTVRIRVLPALMLPPLLLPHFLKHLPRSAALFQIHAHSRTFPRIFSPPPALLSGLPVLSQTLPLNLPAPPDLKPPPLPAVQM